MIVIILSFIGIQRLNAQNPYECLSTEFNIL